MSELKNVELKNSVADMPVMITQSRNHLRPSNNALLSKTMRKSNAVQRL